MTLSLDRAILVPHLRARMPNNLLYCLKLSPRCLHCDTMKSLMVQGAPNTIQVLLTIQTNKRTCRANNCPRSPWQDVGIYCDMHYMIIPYLNNFTFGRASRLVKMSRTLIEKLDGRSILYKMAHQVFMWQTSDLVDEHNLFFSSSQGR
jgi:hypothetical protein